MKIRLFKKTGTGFLVAALAAILVSGGILAACSRATPTTTSAPAATTTSTPATTTSPRPATATTTAPAPATTAAPGPTAPAGPSAADFYRDNVARIIVPYGAGGTTDLYARLIASHWTEVTGGRMIVDNKAGGGGVTGANQAWTAKPDGLTLGLGIYAGLFYPVVEANPAMKFDMHRMQLVVWANNAGSQALSVGINSRYGSAADLKKAEGLKWGSTGARSSESFGAALISELLGLKDAKIVVGYVSSADVALASAKGEVDGYIMSQMSMMQFAEQGLLKWPFIILGLEREAELPDVPALAELAQLTPKQESMLRLVAGINEPGQIMWFQPDVPRDRVEFVRAAVARIMAKESYLAKAKPLWIPLVGPLLGRDLDVKMERILSVATPANFEEVLRLVDKYR